MRCHFGSLRCCDQAGGPPSGAPRRAPGARRTLRFVLPLLVPATLAAQPVYNGDLSLRPDRATVDLVGDTQRTSFWELFLGREQNDVARSVVMGRIAASDPGALIILGDLVFDGGSPDAWRYFDEITTPVRQRGIPVYPVRGNHEYYGSIAQGFRNYFSRFPYLQERVWLAFGYRSAAFILLNSNFDELTPAEVDQQLRWYSRTLDSCQADPHVEAIVVCCHHPPFTNSLVVSDNELVKKHFVPPFLQTPKAVLFFSGHVHAYERFRIGGKQFVVSGGGGGPRQRLAVTPAQQRHSPEYDAGPLGRFHYCEIQFEPSQLRIRMVRLDEQLSRWTTGDEFVVTFPARHADRAGPGGP